MPYNNETKKFEIIKNMKVEKALRKCRKATSEELLKMVMPII